MSDGIKAMYEEAEERNYNRKVKKFKTFDRTMLMNTIDGIEEEFAWLEREDLHMTKAQWSVMSKIRTLLNKIKT